MKIKLILSTFWTMIKRIFIKGAESEIESKIGMNNKSDVGGGPVGTPKPKPQH